MRCSYDKCRAQRTANDKFCILHSHYTNSIEGEAVGAYYAALAHYIADKVADLLNNKISTVDIVNTIYGETDVLQVMKKLQNNQIALEEIHFPKIVGEGKDYGKLLDSVTKPLFVDCIFYKTPPIKMLNHALFEECIFTDGLLLVDGIRGNDPTPVFIQCKFEGPVEVEGDNQLIFERPLFNNCTFESDIRIADVLSNEKMFSFDLQRNMKNDNFEINHFDVRNSQFRSCFQLNYLSVRDLNIQSVEFEKEFELNSSIVGVVVVTSSNFKGTTDISRNRFKSFFTFASTFVDTFNFSSNSIENGGNNGNTTFASTTFSKYANFGKTKFSTGLKLDTANFEDRTSFLNAIVDVEGTSQETFRIIKNSFDSVGNHIEANRYYVEEMRKYRSHVKKNGKFADRLLMNLNYWISNFGQSYTLPIGWLVGFIGLFSLIRYGHDQNWAYKIHPTISFATRFLSDFFNSFANGFLPFTRFYVEGLEFLSLVFYSIYAVLIWQLVTSIRRHLRR